jgi:hypothetical protein
MLPKETKLITSTVAVMGISMTKFAMEIIAVVTVTGIVFAY